MASPLPSFVRVATNSLISRQQVHSGGRAPARVDGEAGEGERERKRKGMTEG